MSSTPPHVAAPGSPVPAPTPAAVHAGTPSSRTMVRLSRVAPRYSSRAADYPSVPCLTKVSFLLFCSSVTVGFGGVDVLHVVREHVMLNCGGKSLVSRRGRMHRVATPHLADLLRRLVTKVRTNANQLVGTDHSEITALFGVNGVTDTVTQPQDTGPQNLEVGWRNVHS